MSCSSKNSKLLKTKTLLLYLYHSIHRDRINLEKLLFTFDFMLYFSLDFVRNCIEFVSYGNHSVRYFLHGKLVLGNVFYT